MRADKPAEGPREVSRADAPIRRQTAVPKQLQPADRATEGAIHIAADLSTAEGAAKVAQSMLDHWGGIDILLVVVGGSGAPGGGLLPSMMRSGSPN